MLIPQAKLAAAEKAEQEKAKWRVDEAECAADVAQRKADFMQRARPKGGVFVLFGRQRLVVILLLAELPLAVRLLSHLAKTLSIPHTGC